MKEHQGLNTHKFQIFLIPRMMQVFRLGTEEKKIIEFYDKRERERISWHPP